MANIQANRTLSGSFAEVWVDGVTMPVIDSLGEEFLHYVKDGMTITVKSDGIVEVE